MQPILGGQITGMLLDEDKAEILHLLESSDALWEREEDIVSVMREHAASSTDQVAQAGSQAQSV